MISKQGHNRPTSVKEFSIPEDYTVQRILVFVKNTLPKFETIIKQSKSSLYKEDDISKELFRYLGDIAREENLLFQFNEKKGVDFTVYVHPFQFGAQPLFMIEAKRLCKTSYDYVSGRNGGIERIKREQDDFGKHLNNGAIVGYIQDENQIYWERKINRWIDDLISRETDIVWDLKDKIVPNTPNSTYKSEHSRISKQKIELHHFWINLN